MLYTIEIIVKNI